MKHITKHITKVNIFVLAILGMFIPNIATEALGSSLYQIERFIEKLEFNFTDDHPYIEMTPFTVASRTRRSQAGVGSKPRSISMFVIDEILGNRKSKSFLSDWKDYALRWWIRDERRVKLALKYAKRSFVPAIKKTQLRKEVKNALMTWANTYSIHAPELDRLWKDREAKEEYFWDVDGGYWWETFKRNNPPCDDRPLIALGVCVRKYREHIKTQKHHGFVQDFHAVEKAFLDRFLKVYRTPFTPDGKFYREWTARRHHEDAHLPALREAALELAAAL